MEMAREPVQPESQSMWSISVVGYQVPRDVFLRDFVP
jgi:hypothetical protein